jgi:competence protein ComFB
MKVYNYMEDIVRDEIDKLLANANTKDICQCQKCRLDMAAWALNRLPPQYVVSDKGRIYTKLNEQNVQFHVDVIREVTRAILKVGKNPRH